MNVSNRIKSEGGLQKNLGGVFGKECIRKGLIHNFRVISELNTSLAHFCDVHNREVRNLNSTGNPEFIEILVKVSKNILLSQSGRDITGG